MYVFIVLTAIVAVIQALPLSEVEEQQWKEFTLTYKKQYENEQEESKRKEIFADNLHKFDDHNKKYAAGIVSYTIGVNQFADLTPEEFSSTLTPMNVSAVTGGLPFVFSSNVKVPDSIDWREKGVVSPVKDQIGCGTAFAYSAVCALEAHLAIKTGRLKELSAENLIDCTYNSTDHECHVGLPSDAFEYVKKNGGIDISCMYPEDGKNGQCRYDPKYSGCICSGVVQLPLGDELALTNAVGTVGPVSVVINGEGISDYTGGVFDGPCDPSKLNHAVVVVGYGTTSDGVPYWIVKNSWGISFGNEGYVFLARNKDQCGLASLASYPIVP